MFLSKLAAYLGCLQRATAETWLPNHSFAEPLSAILRNDWLMGGNSWPDVNGLTLLKTEPLNSGWIASRNPLKTNSFQIMLAVTVVSNANTPIVPGEIMADDPGMMLMFHDRESKPWPPQSGDFYGMYPSIDGHGIFFALTSREHKISPSISFGQKGLNKIQTPMPRGIYWNYLDKKEFEVMLDVLDGKEVHGYIRSKSSDRWTQAFSETLEQDIIKPDCHIILSGKNTDHGVKYTISRLSVTSQDDSQPGYSRNDVPELPSRNAVAKGEETNGDIREALFQLTELFAHELSRSHHFFEEQRNQNKLVVSLLEQIKGDIQSDGSPSGGLEDHITKITSKMENMERSLASRKPSKHERDSLSRVESMFNAISHNNDQHKGSANKQIYFMYAILAIVSAGMGYVIFHMKKLEKKHIL